MKEGRILVVLILLLFSCSYNQKIEEDTKDLKECYGYDTTVIFKRDTVFANKLSSLTEVSITNCKTNDERIGKYINNIPFGFHKFYSKGEVEFIREYVILDSSKLELINYIDPELIELTINGEFFLNRVYNGDNLKERSSSYEINFSKTSESDSILYNVSFYESSLNIEFVQLYIEKGEFLRYIQFEGNSFEFKSIKKEIFGLALLNGYFFKDNLSDTIRGSRMIFFENTP